MQASLHEAEWDAALRPARELRRDLEAQLPRCQARAAEAARAAKAAQVGILKTSSGIYSDRAAAALPGARRRGRACCQGCPGGYPKDLFRIL